jgi:DNA-binding protein YbaB
VPGVDHVELAAGQPMTRNCSWMDSFRQVVMLPPRQIWPSSGISSARVRGEADRNHRTERDEGREPGVSDVPPVFQDLVKHRKNLQQQLAVAQSGLAEMEITAGEGPVTVTMNGDGVVTHVEFDQTVFDERDVAALGTLTLAAIRQAADAANALSAELMTRVFEGAAGLSQSY